RITENLILICFKILTGLSRVVAKATRQWVSGSIPGSDFFRFFENFSMVARSLELCQVYGNWLIPYYIGKEGVRCNAVFVKSVQISSKRIMHFLVSPYGYIGRTQTVAVTWGLSLLLQLCQNGRSLSSARGTELYRLYSFVPLALINPSCNKN
ncbi:hypothetical protein SFRURICE_016064, partial [Spodoptera frugiperda]